ncbi:hypothetical protein SLE2022_210620 [Rubroshorea leprosula]
MDPKVGQWIAKDQVNNHGPTKHEAQKVPKLKLAASTEPESISKGISNISPKGLLNGQPTPFTKTTKPVTCSTNPFSPLMLEDKTLSDTEKNPQPSLPSLLKPLGVDGVVSVPAKAPKDLSVLSQGTNGSPNGYSVGMDLGLCLPQRIRMDNGKTICGLASTNPHKLGSESPRNSSMYSGSNGGIELGGSFQNTEPRVSRRRARRSRNVGQYHSPYN